MSGKSSGEKHKHDDQKDADRPQLLPGQLSATTSHSPFIRLQSYLRAIKHRSSTVRVLHAIADGSLLIRIAYPAALMPPRSRGERARVLLRATG
jgi:hypothetical protein